MPLSFWQRNWEAFVPFLFILNKCTWVKRYMRILIVVSFANICTKSYDCELWSCKVKVNLHGGFTLPFLGKRQCNKLVIFFVYPLLAWCPMCLLIAILLRFSTRICLTCTTLIHTGQDKVIALMLNLCTTHCWFVSQK